MTMIKVPYTPREQRTPGYRINAPFGFKSGRFLGLIHMLSVHLKPGAGFDVFKCVEVHEYRPNIGVTPCWAIQVPCFHPFFHGFTITIKTGSRRSATDASS